MNSDEIEFYDEEDELFAIDDAEQYLFFKSGGDIYAIEVEYVSEMIEYKSLTKIPMMPSFIKGITNIRGTIVTVVDLLERFGFEETIIRKKTSLVIIKNIALIIDEVYDVTSLIQEDIKESLDFGFKIEKRFIKNMAKYEDSYIAILNIEEVLKLEDMSKIEVYDGNI